jgi:hypothetical protein
MINSSKQTQKRNTIGAIGSLQSFLGSLDAGAGVWVAPCDAKANLRVLFGDQHRI